MEERERRALLGFEEWHGGLKKQKGFAPKGTVCGALVVLERLKENWDLNIETHTAPGGSQVRGASGAAAKTILARFGETRRFTAEGGRTNRGLRGDIQKLLSALGESGIGKFGEEARVRTLEHMQAFLVAKVREFHNRAQIPFVFDPAVATRHAIQRLLQSAQECAQWGAVAQHLVGAKLQLRFPELDIENESYSAADDALGRHGDFRVGNTVFHVTVSPSPGHYEKCARNVQDGFRVYLLVPERLATGTRNYVEDSLTKAVAVESIESFVSQNIEELGVFDGSGVASGIRNLLQLYNQRVASVEPDGSLLIAIPPNLVDRNAE